MGTARNSALLSALVESIGDGTAVPTPLTLVNYMPNGDDHEDGEHGTTEIPFQETCSGVSFIQPASGKQEVEDAVAFFKRRWPTRDTREELTPEHWTTILNKWANKLEKPKHRERLKKLMMRAFLIEDVEAEAEITLTIRHIRTYCGNGIRNMMSANSVQGTNGNVAVQHYRPHGICGLVIPYNFPLEIPGLQIISALVCGNLLVIKPHELTGGVVQAFLEIGFKAGLPRDVVALIHGEGKDVAYLGQCEDIDHGVFTGSSAVFKLMSRQWGGEKSGVNPCIVDDLSNITEQQWETVDHRAWTDRARRGSQVCARRAIEFVHANTVERLTAGLLAKVAEEPSPVSPILTWTNERLAGRVQELMAIPGAELVYGGKSVKEPEGVIQMRHRELEYGYFEHTLVRLPLSALQDPAVVKLVNAECFGPVNIQVVWESEQDLQQILEFCANITHKLTAGVVTDRKSFWRRCEPYLRRFGVVYWGLGAGTKGAPDWMGFGPSGDDAAWIGGRPSDVRDEWMTKVETCQRAGVVATFAAA